jgi:hypothetical protein
MDLPIAPDDSAVAILALIVLSIMASFGFVLTLMVGPGARWFSLPLLISGLAGFAAMASIGAATGEIWKAEVVEAIQSSYQIQVAPEDVDKLLDVSPTPVKAVDEDGKFIQVLLTEDKTGADKLVKLENIR